MKPGAPFTAKEFADEVFGGTRSAKWVRLQCALWIRTRGKRGIPVVSASRPYLIPPSAADLFRAPLVFQRAVAVA